MALPAFGLSHLSMSEPANAAAHHRHPVQTGNEPAVQVQVGQQVAHLVSILGLGIHGLVPLLLVLYGRNGLHHRLLLPAGHVPPAHVPQ